MSEDANYEAFGKRVAKILARPTLPVDNSDEATERDLEVFDAILEVAEDYDIPYGGRA